MENFEEVNGLEYVNSESKPSSCSTPKEFSAANDTSNEYISQLLDQKSHTHIPPPAGFDYPTRPSTLLAALVRGPVSLDEASLSPATQRRLQYINKHSQSSHQFSSYLKKRDLNLEGGGSTRKESDCPKLPTSPLSPPSPFQHPFFRKQLGLLPVDAWSRFSGFDFPHFGSIFKDLTSRYTQQQEKESNEVFSSSEENVYVPKRRTINIERENSEKRHYRERKAFSQTYSESESDDDDDNSFSTPITNKNFFLRFSNSHFQAVSGSKEEFGTQYSSSSVTSSSKINNIDLGENADSQSYKDLSYEADIDEDIKSITSKQESFHDCASDCNSYNNISCPEDEISRDTQIVEKNDVDNNVEIDKNTENSFLTKSENTENSSKHEKIHKIVLELLCTERSYVNVLHLLDQEFQFRVDQENRVHHMFPPEQMAFIFSNIKSIYKLHHDFLLPQLEERIAQWDSCCKIGDIMKNFAPFLKMYTEYVKNFDTAMTFINNLQAKNSRFASIMDDIHQMECCGNLTLQHHMLSPVQRIPRYELLLKDYLRKLPETSADREDTEEALRLVSTAANHANEAMKKIDKFKKLLEIQESLGGALELVSPTRELLKEGKIIKISARSGDHQERYVFLLSDILLLCTPRLIGGRVMSGQQYRLKAKYKVENLQVLEGDNLETANTFYIRDNTKVIELYTETREEKEAWLSTLFQAISEILRKKSSLRLAFHSAHKSVQDPDLGLKQPILIRTDSVTKCMNCGLQFSVVRRKHHCRACGSVVCSKCSNFKTSLPCEGGKNVRVCRSCHKTLNESEGEMPNSPLSSDLDNKDSLSEVPFSSDLRINSKIENLYLKSRGILEVPAQSSEAIMEGFLNLKTHKKSWQKRWFSLHRDFVLYSYKNVDDQQALTATPMPGFTITRIQNLKCENGLSEKDRDKAFKVYHSKKQYLFLCPTKDEADRWVAVLQKASCAELPPTQ